MCRRIVSVKDSDGTWHKCLKNEERKPTSWPHPRPHYADMRKIFPVMLHTLRRWTASGTLETVKFGNGGFARQEAPRNSILISPTYHRRQLQLSRPFTAIL